MSSPEAGLGDEARARVERALAADPELRGELVVIEGFLAPASRARFWVAFAEECELHARPAAAALAALSRAARVGGE